MIVYIMPILGCQFAVSVDIIEYDDGWEIDTWEMLPYFYKSLRLTFTVDELEDMVYDAVNEEFQERMLNHYLDREE